ncbi:MAG: LysM peptidoglycan-binding domain-containing protein [Planctomycetota bacterium]|jgi:LysM repeat protein
MHPDKKVGLALGILLIGITGAFFFRNEAPTDVLPASQLSTAESLDRRIDRSGSAPYAAADPVRDTADQLSLPDVPDVDISDVVPQIPDAHSSGLSQTLPEPLRPADATDVLAPLPKPDSLDGDRSADSLRVPVTRDDSKANVRSLTSLPPDDAANSARVNSSQKRTTTAIEQPLSDTKPLRTHTVVTGDNLSRLAEQYLGSQTRYRELYEANRDILKSPDALRVGMQLKIPTKDSRSASQQTSSAQTPASQTAPETAAPRISRKPEHPTFVKPEKSPVVPRPRSSAEGGRSVGQSPPPNLPEVEGLLPEAKTAVLAARPDENE